MRGGGKNNLKLKYRILILITAIPTVLAWFIFFSARWCNIKYGDIGFDAVIFTVLSNVGGTSRELLLDYLGFTVLRTAVLSAATLFLLCFHSESSIFLYIGKRFKFKLYPFKRSVASVLSVILSIALVATAAGYVGMAGWVKGYLGDTHFFEEEYVDPSVTEITFPQSKRNLIYIYLESMETSFFSSELGGALDYNVIPELYTLAEENINFSSSEGVGGCRQINGATWTIGAMVAQTAGIPLKLSIDGNSYGDYGDFLPGVTSLTDILNKNGYHQMLLVGSDAAFGGRSNYYLQHGVDEICDYYTAQTDGIIPSDYYEWWGMEDKYVYEYAKQKLTELATGEQPFSFITLTTDTHHIGGYTCSLCGNEYAESYENAYACASRQLADFLEWIEKQDFYENTTVIITGDHCSMDAEYFERAVDGDYTRRIYNCFLNTAISAAENTKNRDFTQFDMFPTTLAAIGVEIDGERLGLGTNLFSGKKTLAEKYGFDTLEQLISTRSGFYNDKFLFNRPI